MRRVRVLGSNLGLLAFVGACATAPGGVTSSQYDASPSQSRRLSGAQLFAERDSILAQVVAEREGPRVHIAAEMTTGLVSSRRLRANFRLDDDAYVLIGHLGPDGVVRIVFPTDPRDDGFVRGRKSYHTAEFFAGFADQYRYRYASGGMFRSPAASIDSYDRGMGYVFIVASWRPMRFDRFANNNSWDSFEIAEEDYLRDPRPAIYELASLLAGVNTEAYTVKFARYFNTNGPYGYGGYLASSVFGSAYCSGYQTAGFGFSPFDDWGYGYSSVYQYGGSFMYRGSRYVYDAAAGCYRRAPVYYGNPYRIAQGQQPIPPTSRPRAFRIDDNPRNPLTPKAPPQHVMPQSGQQASTDGPLAVPVSPQYRQRGLITADEPGVGPIRREPRVEGRNSGDERVRPSLQEMVNRRNENDREGSGWSRAHVNDEPRGGYSRPTPNDNPRTVPSRSEPRPRTDAPQRYEPSPRIEAPDRREPSPRVESPPMRHEPPPRIEAPITRSEPSAREGPAARIAPPPAPAAPRSEPPASKPPEIVKPPNR